MVVRDDVAANGKLYIAPLGMLTSMRSIKPEVFKENFEWYVAPADRPVPVQVAANDTQQLPLTSEVAETWPEGKTVDDLPEDVPSSAPDPTPPPPHPDAPDGTPILQEPTPTAPVKRGRPVGAKNKKKRKSRKT